MPCYIPLRSPLRTNALVGTAPELQRAVVPDSAPTPQMRSLSRTARLGSALVQVIYNTSGWLDKNNDPPPTDFLEAIKEKSTFGFSKVQYSPVLTAVRMGFSL